MKKIKAIGLSLEGCKLRFEHYLLQEIIETMFLLPSVSIKEIEVFLNNIDSISSHDEAYVILEDLKSQLDKINKHCTTACKLMEEKIGRWEKYCIRRHISKKHLKWVVNFYPGLKDFYNKRFYSMNSPSIIERELNKVVMGQKEAIREFSLLLYKYLLFIFMVDESFEDASNFTPDNSIFIGGPTGCGKSLLVKSAAALLNLKLIVIDASQLTSSGYHGNSVSDVLAAGLNRLSKKDHSRLIIFIDEVDKIVTGRLSVKSEVRFELLTLLCDKTLTLRDNTVTESYDLKGSLIILAGSFESFTILRNSIGFTEKKETVINYFELLYKLFGAEFAGRISHFISMQRFESVEAFQEILLFSEKSPLRKLRNFFEAHSEKLETNAEDIKAIAEKAMFEGTGARGLEKVVNEYFKNEIHQVANKGLFGRENLPF